MAGGWGKRWRETQKWQRIVYLSEYCVISLGRMALVRHLCFSSLIITNTKTKSCFLDLNYILLCLSPPYVLLHLLLLLACLLVFSNRLIPCVSLSFQESVMQSEIQASCHSERLRYNWSKCGVMRNNPNDSPNLSFGRPWLLLAHAVGRVGANCIIKNAAASMWSGGISTWAC